MISCVKRQQSSNCQACPKFFRRGHRYCEIEVSMCAPIDFTFLSKENPRNNENLVGLIMLEADYITYALPAHNGAGIQPM